MFNQNLLKMEKIRNEKDFLSEAEMINVMGGMLEPCTEQEGIRIYIQNGCSWADCSLVCGPIKQ